MNQLRQSLHFKEHWTLASVLCWSVFVVLSSVVYFFFGITTGTAVGVFVGMAMFCWYIFWPLPQVRFRLDLSPGDQREWLLTIYAALVDCFIFFVLWRSRTDVTLATPWRHVNIWLFVLYALSTAAVFMLLLRREKRTVFSTLVLLLHFFIFFGVALIVFRYGYGYDPIIHQAAEQYIIQHGKILPLNPFYIGQYALVSTLASLVRISVLAVDRLLLPLLATVSIPLLAWQSFRVGYRVQFQALPLVVLGVLVFPLSALTFTVPYNLTVLYAVWWMLVLPFADSGSGRVTLCAVSLAALFTHPLLGVPLFVATLGVIAETTICATASPWRKVGMNVITGATIAVAPVLLFGYYRITQGLSPFATWKFWEATSTFFYIFRYPYDLQSAPWGLSLIYYFAQYEWYVIICGGLVAIFLAKEIPRWVRAATLTIGFGILASTFFLTTMIEIPNVPLYQQSEFALRLRQSVPLFFLPLLLLALAQRAESLLSKKYGKILCAGCVGGVVAVSLFLTYPQTNVVVNSNSWNISRADIEGVHAIIRDAEQGRFVVLGDQIFSATALRTLGFGHELILPSGEAIHPVALSPNDFLYPVTQKILYGQFSAEDMNLLRSQTRARIYLAVHDYWYRVNELNGEALSAGGVRVPGLNDVTIWKW